MGLGLVGIGPRQQHQHIGAAGEGAPRLDAVDQPAAFDRNRGRRHPGDVRPEVGLGDGDRPHHLPAGQPGQPQLLLLLGPTTHERPGEDLGSGDEGTAGAQRAPRELFGGHHHAHVVGLAPGGEASVLLGHRHPEPAHLRHPGDDLLGDVRVGSVDVLGPRPDLLLGEAVEGLPHQFEVGIEMARPFPVGQSGQEFRVPVGGHEGLCRCHPVGAHAPLPGAADGPRRQVGHRVGDEGTCDPGFGVPVRPVGQCRLGRTHGGGGMGHVVGQDLGHIGPPGPGQGVHTGGDHRLGHAHRVGGGDEVGHGQSGGHAPRLPKRRRHHGADRSPSGPGFSAPGPGPRR